jgi:4-amino-4-deoxy-L-arabinose transferase-like glycosyltransferase
VTQSQANPQCADPPVKEARWLRMLPSSFASASRLKTGLVVAAVLILALLLRVIHLDADPSALISRDFITDEGWWTHNARNALFHGQFRMDDYNLGFYSSPLYNYAIYSILKLLGISFITVRLLPAVCGWLAVVVLFLLVRREINTRAALFAAVLLGCSNVHVLYSRTGFVESAMVFLLALTLLLWSLRRSHALFSVASGLAFGVMVIAKITAIYLVPGLLLMWAALIIRDSSNVKYVIRSLLGIFLSGAVFVALYVIPNFHDWLHFNISNGSGSEWSNESGGLILSLLKLPDSYFNKLPAMIAGLTLLIFALFAISVSRSGWKRAIREAPEIELVGGSLLIGYLIPLALTIYQPERRFIPALLLGVMLAASLLERGVTASGESLLGEPDGWGWAIWFCVLFFLPALVIVKFKWAALGSPLSARFWAIKSSAAALFIWMAWAVSKKLSSRTKRRLLTVCSSIFVLVFASLCLAAVYRALALSGLDWHAFKSPAGHSLGVLILVGVALAASVLAWKAMRFGLSRPGWLVGAFLFVEGVQVSTWLLQPTYTLRDASKYFAGTLTAGDTVVTPYETLLIPSAANVICRSQRRGFNVDAFQRFDPRYTLILRRDDWIYYPLEGMQTEEWPPPARFVTAKVAGFDLCPTHGRGPRFTAELYRLDPRVRGRDKSGR